MYKYLHEDVNIPENLGSQPQCLGRSAHSTKAAKSTTMCTAVNAALLEIIGVSKSSQNVRNVRNIYFYLLMQFFCYVCKKIRTHKWKFAVCIY